MVEDTILLMAPAHLNFAILEEVIKLANVPPADSLVGFSTATQSITLVPVAQALC
jgi:hypothetical protein